MIQYYNKGLNKIWLNTGTIKMDGCSLRNVNLKLLQGAFDWIWNHAALYMQLWYINGNKTFTLLHHCHFANPNSVNHTESCDFLLHSNAWHVGCLMVIFHCNWKSKMVPYFTFPSCWNLNNKSIYVIYFLLWNVKVRWASGEPYSRMPSDHPWLKMSW